MNLPSKKGDLLDWAGHPSSQASVFFFSRKRFVMFCKEMYEKVDLSVSSGGA